MGRLNVAVLMGGRSEERDVSLVTGRMIMNALDPDKYNAFPIDTARYGTDAEISGTKQLTASSTESLDSLAQMLPLDYIAKCDTASKPDVAFIALHGKYGEDGTVQGLLELLDIPYVGSGVLASALAMDKIMARKVMEYDGVPVPKGISVHPDECRESQIKLIEDGIGYPAVVKPSKQGSTIGLSIAHSRQELADALELAFVYDSDVLIEQFVKGVEITVPVLGNNDLRVLPVVEIIPSGGFYDYHSKYTPGATEEIVPARIPADMYKKAEDLALVCHRSLGCRGMSRTDMIVDGDSIYVLEVNTIPGMTPTSLLPTSAKAAGIDFSDLLDQLINYAIER
ncbi:MAG: D-alanine--D-alanine ligase family protein [Armatimonadota bacterium]